MIRIEYPKLSPAVQATFFDDSPGVTREQRRSIDLRLATRQDLSRLSGERHITLTDSRLPFFKGSIASTAIHDEARPSDPRGRARHGDEAGKGCHH